VKCSSADKALVPAGAGADIVLLDNLAPRCPLQDLPAAEACGGIVLGSLPQFLGPHIHVVSMACLTHGAPSLDFALQV
ncbi:NADC pyrophosphorylase, partial [Hylia prasina]|nr:NADC pyrophosphorylase [Hylia prasina]